AIGYYPHIFERMLSTHGGVQTARRLSRQGDIQDGLVKVVRHGREDLSVEHLMLQPEFADLFTDEEPQAARWRLEQAREKAGRTKPKPPPASR
ncbi:MAG: hypothetical protein D6740_08775, partial [Alphaproteobacteria bacterium]